MDAPIKVAISFILLGLFLGIYLINIGELIGYFILGILFLLFIFNVGDVVRAVTKIRKRKLSGGNDVWVGVYIVVIFISIAIILYIYTFVMGFIKFGITPATLLHATPVILFGGLIILGGILGFIFDWRDRHKN